MNAGVASTHDPAGAVDYRSTRYALPLPAGAGYREDSCRAVTGRQDWIVRAACRALDSSLFFPGLSEDAESALVVCRACPVREECLAHALARPELLGIWGGETEPRRRRISWPVSRLDGTGARDTEMSEMDRAEGSGKSRCPPWPWPQWGHGSAR